MKVKLKEQEMISKELLCEVLEIEIVDYAINENQVRINQLWHEDNPLNRALELINTSYGCRASINIYELAHKCKEWAKAYTLVSAYYFENGEEGAWCCLHKNLCSTDGETFHADNEPEAIFKACQWILENKN